jgi:DNA-binding HxlR family transcriptional regulator
MPTRRSYGDACGIARALDVVGERWALLVVRELLLGPRRFSDLRRALPRASSNLVSDRLHELEANGVIGHRRLPPPAGSWVYELTESGRELQPIVLALGSWGLRVPLPPPPRTVSAASALLYLQGVVRPEPDVAPTVCRLELDEDVWTITLESGRVNVEPGEPTRADVAVHTDPESLVAILDDPAAHDADHVVISGDVAAWRALVRSAVAPVA